MSSTKNYALKVVELLEDKKAQDIVVISVEGKSPLADYFVIATASSTTQMNALSSHLEKELRSDLKHREGKEQGGWMLLDFKDVVVHIFSKEMRDYYSLERVWNDAPRIQITA